MPNYQTGILADVPEMSRYLSFSLIHGADVTSTLAKLADTIDGESTVIGFGPSLVATLGKSIEGLRSFPAYTAGQIDIPSTQNALWLWLRGSDKGELFHRSRELELITSNSFVLDEIIDSFKYDIGRDISGYEDGTENPEGQDAIDTAIIQDAKSSLNGSSFVATQQWLHDMDTFHSMSTEEQDDCVGRHIEDNEEFDEAPESAHVKRSAQESFDPEAFMLRRSMPWANDMSTGLNFIAFGKSFDAFEAILDRMTGKEDGIIDGLFEFTRPINGSYFWCPPMKDGKIDLSALSL